MELTRGSHLTENLNTKAYENSYYAHYQCPDPHFRVGTLHDAYRGRTLRTNCRAITRDRHGIGQIVRRWNGVPGVNIWRKGSVNEGTVTDNNGRFTYPKPLAAGEVLIFSYVSMERREYVVPADYQQGAVIDMGMNLNMISELVVTGEPRMEATRVHGGIFRKLRAALK